MMSFFSRSKSQSVDQQPSNISIATASSETLYQTSVAGSESTPPQPSPRAFPWSARSLNILPPSIIDNSGVAPSTTPSPSPFPRYGHVVPSSATPSGELYLFGGLDRDYSPRNDVHALSTVDNSVRLVQTFGQIPSPRVGHACALMGSTLVVFGGDTATGSSDSREGPQSPDNGLFMLDLLTREWTQVNTVGPGPAARYGHKAAVFGSKFIVFGGQANELFMNDIWAFNMSSLAGGQASASWELLEPTSADRPAPRTGYVCVPYDGQLIVFGGTDGKYHYNDTWSFNFQSRKWSEFSCVGFIPNPREGHAAAIVDNIIYILGGRGIDGKELADLAALRITSASQRWYMFQNMGPSPSGRSGHAMSTIGRKVFVVGGDSFIPSKEDPDILHVLNTERIRYPNIDDTNL